MAVRAKSIHFAGVYSAQASIRSEVLAQVASAGLEGIEFKKWVDLEDLLTEVAVAAVVLHMDCRGLEHMPDPQEQLEQLLGFIPSFHRNHPAGQVILISSGELSLEWTCQAAASGISAIVPLEDAEYAQKIEEHILNSYQHYLKQSQQKKSSNQDKRNGLVGNSAALNKVLDQARRAALVSDAPVIIHGESGTGKQKVAELIHQWDRKRQKKPFITVNCAAITKSLAESELFGHVKGAYTGATEDRLGYFRAANHGTILLDEVSELSLSLQPKVLRILQEGLVMPVGSDTEYKVDVRVLAATNRDLSAMVDQGKFRLDLLQRLSVIQLTVPTLRQRTEDIPELFQSFLQRYAHYSELEIQSVAPEVYQVLAESIGAGNVRELENLVRQILVFKEKGNSIEITDLPHDILTNRPKGSQADDGVDIPDELIEALLNGRKHLSAAIDDCEREMLKRLVQRDVKQSVLASRLGITRRTLYNKLQKHRLQ